MTHERQKHGDLTIDVRLKLAGLWTSIMVFYVYADLLGVMQAKAEGQLLDKNLGPFGPITQGALLGIAIMLAIPASMIFLSLVLKASHSRWTNIVIGASQLLVAIGTFLMPCGFITGSSRFWKPRFACGWSGWRGSGHAHSTPNDQFPTPNHFQFPTPKRDQVGSW